MTWISFLVFFIISTSFGGTLLVCLWCIFNKLINQFISTSGNYRIFKAIILFYITPIVYWERLYDIISDEELLSSVPIIGLINPHMSRILFLPFIVWFIGAIIVFLYTLYTYIYFYFHVLKYNARITDPTIIDMEKHISQKLKLKKSLPLYYNDTISSPMLAGIFVPKILLPSGFPSEDLMVMLYHENIHYKQHDLLFKQLGNLILCLHWFNPFVHKLTKLINEWCEYNCDNLCCKNHDLFSPKEYASTLLKLATLPSMSFHLNYSAFSEKTGHLESRIKRIVTEKKSFQHASVLAFATGIFFFGFGTLSVNAASNEFLSYYYDWYYDTSNYIKEEPVHFLDSPVYVLPSEEYVETGIRTENAPTEDTNDIFYYFWKIKKNNGINSMKIEGRKGDTLFIAHTMMKQDVSLHHGIIDLEGNIHYVDGLSHVVFRYEIPEDGTYTIFCQNPTNEDVNINGFYYFE